MSVFKLNRCKTSNLPSHHANNTGTAFKNPWPSAQPPSWTELIPSSFPLSLYKANLHTHPHVRPLQVIKPDWGAASLATLSLSKSDCLIGTWLGHASASAEFPSLSSNNETKSTHVLFDPIFSTRAGPTAAPGVGPSRLKPAPCQVADLLGVDVVCISHNHYDHLDFRSIKAILKHFPEAKFLVPLGVKQWMVETGAKKEAVTELDWWDEVEISLGDGKSEGDMEGQGVILKLSCVPAQHNSGRLGYDQNSTLWCGWVIERFVQESTNVKRARKGAVYHAGDTGYRRATGSEAVCPVFEEIGKKFGGMDLSFIPIWRGGSLGFVSYWGLRLSHHEIPAVGHCSPADAVAIHQDVKSKNTVAVHFGTFIGSEYESHDAMKEFGEACEEAGVIGLEDAKEESEMGRAGALDLGGSVAVKIR